MGGPLPIRLLFVEAAIVNNIFIMIARSQADIMQQADGNFLKLSAIISHRSDHPNRLTKRIYFTL
jgi:hypothetical protein